MLGLQTCATAPPRCILSALVHYLTRCWKVDLHLAEQVFAMSCTLRSCLFCHIEYLKPFKKKCIAVLWSKIGSLPVCCGLTHPVGEAKLLLSWVGPGWQWLYPLLLSLPHHSGKGRYPLLSDLNSSDLAEPPRESQGSLRFCEPCSEDCCLPEEEGVCGNW